jgi:hypothetical protein
MIEAQSLLKEFVAIAKDFGAKGHVSALVSGGIPGSLNVILEYADPRARRHKSCCGKRRS